MGGWQSQLDFGVLIKIGSRPIPRHEPWRRARSCNPKAKPGQADRYFQESFCGRAEIITSAHKGGMTRSVANAPHKVCCPLNCSGDFSVKKEEGGTMHNGNPRSFLFGSRSDNLPSGARTRHSRAELDP